MTCTLCHEANATCSAPSGLPICAHCDDLLNADVHALRIALVRELFYNVNPTKYYDYSDSE